MWAGCWRGGRGGPFLSPRQSRGDGGIVYSASRHCRAGGAASQRRRRPPRRGGKGRSCRPSCPTPEMGVPVPSGGSRGCSPFRGVQVACACSGRDRELRGGCRDWRGPRAGPRVPARRGQHWKPRGWRRSGLAGTASRVPQYPPAAGFASGLVLDSALKAACS